MIIDLAGEDVHENDEFPNVSRWHGAGCWEFVPRRTGRRCPITKIDMTKPTSLVGYVGFKALTDNKGDVKATSPLFAPIAKGRREREDFLLAVRVGTQVEAPWPHLCTDNDYHMFLGTVCSITEYDFVSFRDFDPKAIQVEVAFSIKGKKPGPVEMLRLADVRKPHTFERQLTGDSVVHEWCPGMGADPFENTLLLNAMKDSRDEAGAGRDGRKLGWFEEQAKAMHGALNP